MNEFINNHLECIERPISKGCLQGFLLNNGFRIFFKKSESLTRGNRTRLINLYKKLYKK